MDDKTQRRKIDWHRIEVVDEDIAAILRTKTPAERIVMAAAAHRTARTIYTALTKSEHPEWTAEQVQREVARRLTRGTD